MSCATAAHAKQLTEMQHRQVLMDLQFIPDDKLEWVPMGQAKSPKQIAVECGGAYRWVAGKLRGDGNADAVWGEGAGLSPTSREEMVELMEDGWAELAATFDTIEECQLAETRPVFWGEETVENILFFGQWHTTYHSGQLNYIQTLLGDTEMHMEPPS